MFEITIDCSDGRKLGIELDASDGRTLLITSILGGLIHEWNDACEHGYISVGDYILSVNSAQGDAKMMLREIQSNCSLKMVVSKHPDDDPNDCIIFLPLKTKELGLTDMEGTLLEHATRLASVEERLSHFAHTKNGDTAVVGNQGLDISIPRHCIDFEHLHSSQAASGDHVVEGRLTDHELRLAASEEQLRGRLTEYDLRLASFEDRLNELVSTKSVDALIAEDQGTGLTASASVLEASSNSVYTSVVADTDQSIQGRLIECEMRISSRDLQNEAQLTSISGIETRLAENERRMADHEWRMVIWEDRLSHLAVTNVEVPPTVPTVKDVEALLTEQERRIISCESRLTHLGGLASFQEQFTKERSDRTIQQEQLMQRLLACEAKLSNQHASSAVQTELLRSEESVALQLGEQRQEFARCLSDVKRCMNDLMPYVHQPQRNNSENLQEYEQRLERLKLDFDARLKSHVQYIDIRLATHQQQLDKIAGNTREEVVASAQNNTFATAAAPSPSVSNLQAAQVPGYTQSQTLMSPQPRCRTPSPSPSQVYQNLVQSGLHAVGASAGTCSPTPSPSQVFQNPVQSGLNAVAASAGASSAPSPSQVYQNLVQSGLAAVAASAGASSPSPAQVYQNLGLNAVAPSTGTASPSPQQIYQNLVQSGLNTVGASRGVRYPSRGAARQSLTPHRSDALSPPRGPPRYVGPTRPNVSPRLQATEQFSPRSLEMASEEVPSERPGTAAVAEMTKSSSSAFERALGFWTAHAGNEDVT